MALPGGPGKDLVEARCTVCHDLERVASANGRNPNGRPSSPTWSAAATPDVAQAISAYLASHFSGE